MPSDVSCKAHRQLLAGQLRGTNWHLAHSLNPAVHDTCTNLAAAVAALPPVPVTPLPPKGAAAAAGQDWGALISSSVVRSRLATGGATGGSGGGMSSTGSSIKTMKAARALVEDVQRAFGSGAAGSARPPGGRR